MNGGDLTRSTFRPHRHYSGVRMQQGRVQLDADWNEQLDLAAHRDRAASRDVIGTTGVPKTGGGFALTVAPDGRDLLLSPGRAWVEGHLCEVDGETTAVTDTPSTTSVTVASLVLDGAELAADAWVEVTGDAGSVVTRAASVDVATRTVALDDPVDALTGPLALRRRWSYADQPDLPEPEHTAQASATDPRLLDLPEGSWLAHLDVWERSVTALDDPLLTEPALGVDTSTRTRVVWQLRLLDLSEVTSGPVDCDTDLDAALAALAPPTGRMAARAEPPAGSEDLCRPTPAGGYVGLENQLYRVHVHDLAADGSPVVLWSRENASVLTGWTATLASDVLRVAGIGKDAVLGFRPGDWVELLDDTCTLHGRPGTLVRLLDARDDRLVLDPTTPTGSTDIADFPRNPQVRRWDSPGPVDVVADEWWELEEGVQVRFPAGGTYRRGDHWLVPARSVLADVDWPRDSGGAPLALPPAGTPHAVGRLALVTRTATGLSVTDCRARFPSLTSLTADDVAVDNDVCDLPGVETVQDALDALCRTHDLRRHNRLLHGYGIVCGLAVHCGPDASDDPDNPRAGSRRGGPLRRFVTVLPGNAIDPDGYDLEVPEPVEVDVLRELRALGEGVLDQEGDGEVRLALRHDPDRGPVVVVTRYVAPGPRQFLEGTLLKDVYDDCIVKLYDWVKAQLAVTRTRDPEAQKRAHLLRTALTNLLAYVANPKSGGNVFVAENEHEALAGFYEGLRKRLRSHTFCAMFDDARPYPDYPESLAGIRTIAGEGRHARVRIHPGGREAWTTGGGLHPWKPATMINRYSLEDERFLGSVDPVGDAAAAVTDVAFSPDGRLVYAAVPTRDGHDTLFRVGEIGRGGVTWRPATTICGVKLVTLATTEADPDHVYAVGQRRTSSGKAVSLREYTGAGIWRINPKDVPEGLGPIEATASLNTVGHLVISPQGEAVFTVGQPGATTQRYDRLVTLTVPSGDARETLLDGSGDDDLALVLGSTRTRAKARSAWTVVGSGRGRQVVGVDLASGEVRARVSVPASGRLSLQAVDDRLLVADSNASMARVLDCTREELVDGLLVPVQVAPMSATALPREARQVVVLNVVSNSLTAIDADIVRGDRFDLGELVRYRRAAVEAFADLVGGLAQYLKDCLCDHVLVSCPPELEDKDLDLAVVSIRGGSVHRVCNFSGRRYVKSFPTVGYWLSLVPVLPALREAVAKACCTVLPELFGRYTTKGHDDAGDRIDAQKVLRFLELVQEEDPRTRLRNLDLGFLSFLRGANTGEWDEPEAQPTSSEPRQPGVFSPDRGTVLEREPLQPGVREDLQPRVPELIVRNLLRNPAIGVATADVVTRAAEHTVVEREALEPREVERLLTRVDALETEIARLRTNAPSRPDRDPPR